MAELKGGQSVNESLFGAIQASYQNLVYHPVALLLSICNLYELLYIYDVVSTSPFRQLADKVDSCVDRECGWLSVFAVILNPVFSWCLARIYGLFVFTNVLVPYVCKPSARSMFVVLILVMVVGVADVSVFCVYFLSQLVYLFVMLRSPGYKLVVIILFLLILDFSNTKRVLRWLY